MGQLYKVQFAKRLDGADNYGNVTDSVKFETEGESVLWSHQPTTTVEPGVEVFGHIEDLVSRNGKPYRKFKREQQEGQGFTPQQPTASTQTSGQSGYSKGSDDRADGMRQGMCINNAAAYVASAIDTALTQKEWSELVHSYASALYALGDLKMPEQPGSDVVAPVSDDVTDADLLKDIDNIGF